MNLRFCIRAALCVAPVTLAAQTQGLRQGSVIVSAGVGSGSASLSCEACPSQRDAGLSALVGVGMAVRPGIAVAAEVNRWTKDYADTRGSATARLLFVNVTAQWYPRPSSNVFVKGGGGLASIRDDISMGALGRTAVTAKAPAFVAGAGWNVPLARDWAVTPYVDLNYAMKGNQVVNGARPGQKLGGTLLHFGVAATRADFLRMPKRVPPAVAPVPIVATVNQDSIDRAREAEAAAREAAAAAEQAAEAGRATIATAIHYDFGKADLRNDARQALDEKIPILAANADLSVRIVGHTDGRGSGEDNRQLGQRRATAVRDYFLAAGVSPDRLEIVSLGAERPLCQSRDEGCWSRNRRVEFEIVVGASTLKTPQ